MLVTFLLTLVPFLWGYVFGGFVVGFYFKAIVLWELAFAVYWFWVGMRFGTLRVRPVASFLLGNAAWLFSLALYVWQFALLSDVQRGPGLLSLLPQLYPFGLVSLSSRLAALFSTNVDPLLPAYALMLIIFAVGFAYGRRRRV